MTNDKIYAILIIVYCSLCKWSMGHSAERKHYGLFVVSLFNIPDPESIINICFHGEKHMELRELTDSLRSYNKHI